MSPESTRRYPRIQKLFLLAFVSCAEGRQKSPVSIGRIFDINQAGFGMETFQELQVGSELEMEVDLHDMIVQVEGTVVHVRPEADGKYIVGIEFKEQQERLTKHVVA